MALNAALGTLTVAGVYALGRRDYSIGALPCWPPLRLSALYPGAIGMSVFVLSEAAFCPLLMAQLTRDDAGLAKRRYQGHDCACRSPPGCIAGIATLVRPSWLLFVALRAGRRFDFRSGTRQGIYACGVLLARRAEPGDGAVVGAQLPHHRAFRAHDAASRRQPVRRH